MDRRGYSSAAACRLARFICTSVLTYLHALVFITLCSQPFVANAESVFYHGVSIAVESLSVQVPGFDTITLAGEKTLVPSAESGRWAVLQIIKRSSSSAPFPCDTGVAVFRKATEAGDLEVMREVMRTAGRKGLCAEEGVASVLGASTTLASEREKLARFFSSGVDFGAPNPLFCEAFAVGAVPDQPLPTLSRPVCEYCSARLSKRLLAGLSQRGDLIGSREELALGLQAFGSCGLPESDSLEGLSSLTRNLQVAADKGDVEQFATLKQALTQRAGQLDVPVNSERIDEWFIARGLERGDTAAVSRCLAAMVFEHRSPAMHEHVLQLIRMELERGIDLNSFFLLQSSLARYAEKDDEIASVYRELVPAAIQESLRQGRSKEAVALAKSAGVSVAVPLRVRLLVGGSWGQVPIVVLGLVIVLAACALFVLCCKRKRPPRVVKGSTGESAHADSEEYLNALSTFGLKPGASIVEIKNAYRRDIKQFHPDLASGKSDEARQRFLELTNRYEYLLSFSAGKK